MTDITELAQSLKAAAEKWQEAWGKYDKVEITIAEFIRAANQYESIVKDPANVIELVEALEKAQQRNAELESRTVKLPDELSGETLLDNYSDVVYSDDTGVLEYTNIIGCFVKITAPPDKVIRFRLSNEGMYIRLVDRVKTHEHAGIIIDISKNYKDFIQ